MICPYCSADNMPGVDNCEDCGQDLTSFDKPEGRSPIEASLMEATLEVVQGSERALRRCAGDDHLQPSASVALLALELALTSPRLLALLLLDSLADHRGPLSPFP